MKEVMDKLISLQQIDSEIARLDRNIAKYGEEIAIREQNIVEKREKLAAMETKLSLLTEKQRENEVEHEEALARVRDGQNKMLMVQTSREHTALLKELEDNKKISKNTEERALQFIEQIEQIKVDIERLKAATACEEEAIAGTKSESAKKVERLHTEKQKKEKERNKKAAEVEPEFMSRYNKLMGKRCGLAVAALQGSVCMGCHMTLPPQRVNEIMKGDKINTCPTCQRILYYLPTEESKRPAPVVMEEDDEQFTE